MRTPIIFTQEARIFLLQSLKDMVAIGWYWIKMAEAGLPSEKVPIFTYHSVGHSGDPFFPSMPIELFEQQVRYLSSHFRFLSFGNFLEKLRLGEPMTSQTAILTFDDGYKDNFHMAFPVLKKYQASATIFLTTGSIGTGEALWFDRLASMVKNTSQKTMDWNIDGMVRTVGLESTEEKLRALDSIKSDLKSVSNLERLSRLRDLENSLGSPDHENLKERMLDWDDVRALDNEGIEFGGHSTTHPILSSLSPGEAMSEIRGSVEEIEGRIQKKVRSFAYPNGTSRDFNPAVVAILKSCGIFGACTTIEGLTTLETYPYAVPRIYTTDRNFYRFFWRLSHLPTTKAA